MISPRYHFLTIVALFLALSIGIFIGGTFGSTWMDVTEQAIFDKLLDKYEQQLEINKSVTYKMDILQNVNRQLEYGLKNKTIAYVSSQNKSYDELLGELTSLFGVKWVNWSELDPSSDSDIDVLIVNDDQFEILSHMEDPTQLSTIVRLGTEKPWDTPEEMAQFMIFLSKLLEEKEDEPLTEAKVVDFNYYPSME
ncbi:copper transporter [Longirhabdus pacifica]|uniref:copper transporter n=1 Tax=Longirhabdus pacifica TaxID=2305227 RepID=UPI0013E8A00B|nr:copper transporter [Longirhabdus pacifica]